MTALCKLTFVLFQMGSTSTVPFVNIFASLFITVVVPILCGQVRSLVHHLGFCSRLRHALGLKLQREPLNYLCFKILTICLTK